ncbi:hypothetical protein ACTXGQ_04150 [Marinobacter sp. 1Y8]
MPNGPIAADDYIDDPERTTEEVQDALNQLFDYSRSLQVELEALSSTEIREAAVRSVGSGVGEVPDKAVLDARLGTTGDLDLSNYLPKSEFNPEAPTLVWSGAATTVPITSLSRSGSGFYFVVSHSGIFSSAGTFYMNITEEKGQAVCGISVDRAVVIGLSSGTNIVANYVTISSTAITAGTITKIYKV